MAANAIEQVEGNDQASSRATLNQDIALNSLQAQKILKRSYARLSDALFSASVVLRTKCTREEADGDRKSTRLNTSTKSRQSLSKRKQSLTL